MLSVMTIMARSGSAYVYVRSNGVWSEQQKLTASDGARVITLALASRSRRRHGGDWCLW